MSNDVSRILSQQTPVTMTPNAATEKSETDEVRDTFKKSLGDKSGKPSFLGARIAARFRESEIGKKLIKKDTKAALAVGKVGTITGGLAGMCGAFFLAGVVGGATGLGCIPAFAVLFEEMFFSGVGLSLGGIAGGVVGSNIGNAFQKMTGIGSGPPNVK